MAIHLVDADNRHLYKRELDDLFRARKQVFVDGFGWDLPVTDGREIDQFDDDRACYLLGFDTAHNVVMSFRLRPTDDVSLVGDVFGHSIAEGSRPIDDGRTWEATRGFCLEYGRKPWNMRRKGACMIAPFEVIRDAGMDRLVAFTDVRMFNWMLSMGWEFNTLGDSIPYGEGAGFALEVEITDSLIASMRAQWELKQRSYLYVDALATGESIHDAAARIAHEQDITYLEPRDDLSRLRRPLIADTPASGPGAHAQGQSAAAA